MIVYIHGASATAESFTHIRQFVRDHTEEPDTALEYNSEAGFEHNLAAMKGQLDDEDRLFFVSHSLGGIYALHLANNSSSSIAFMQAQAMLNISEGIKNGQVQTIVVPSNFNALMMNK